MPRKSPKKSTESLESMVDRIDLPHKRHSGWEWKKKGAAPVCKPGFSRDRLIHYAKQLRDLGMDDADIMCMFSDLYWDAFWETTENDSYKKLKESRES